MIFGWIDCSNSGIIPAITIFNIQILYIGYEKV